MAKAEQVLVIEPQHELSFVGPFNTAVSAVMALKNPSDRKVCFKIKTTAPKRYCVKPNSGWIDPRETLQIAVSLQPFEYDPQEKNRHKFMVQSMFAPDGYLNQDENINMWKDTDGSQLMDSKLKCVFVMPDNNMVTSNGSAPSSLDHAKPDPYHQADTVRVGSVSSSVSAPPKPLAASSSPKVSYADGDRNSEGLKKSIDEIKRLQEEVSALRQDNLQLKEEALRQKRLASSRSEAASSVTSSNRNEAFSVSAMNPDATALSTTYIYAALVVLVLGIIIGKWIF